MVGLTDNLILWVVGLNSNLMGGGGKIKVKSKTPIIFVLEQPSAIQTVLY